MIIVLPIGHDRITLRSLPFATLGLIALSVAVAAIAGDADAASTAALGPVRITARLFLSPSWALLVVNMLFLWVAGIGLEDRWGRLPFVALYLLAGTAGLALHGALAGPDEAPYVGSSAALAGVMGAFAVRLPRTRVHFVWAMWLTLKPRYGRFRAPAWGVLAVWVVCQGLLVLLVDGVPWSSPGLFAGFAIGAATAVAFRLGRVESRFLGRQENPEDIEADPDQLPLVAFGNRSPAPASAAAPSRRAARAASLSGIDSRGFHVKPPGGPARILAPGEIAALAAGRVDRTDDAAARALFAGQVPVAPALLLAVSVRGEGSVQAVFVIDVEHISWLALMSRPRPSPRENLAALVKLLLGLCPGAAVVGDRDELSSGRLPTFTDVEDLLSRLRRAGAAATPPPERGLPRAQAPDRGTTSNPASAK
jgi:membrane associated rhomboid family serine protease